MEQIELSSIAQVKKEGNKIYILRNRFPSEELQKFITKQGNRGILSGSETSSSLTGSQTIDANSPDTITIETSGNVTITFTSASQEVTAVKVISLTASGTTTLTISGASWANSGEAPVWGTSGKHLILVAHFISGRVILNVFDNDE